jgi:hypothetical protein
LNNEGSAVPPNLDPDRARNFVVLSPRACSFGGTQSQIISILKEVEAGRTRLEVCRKHGISEQTL